jgi:enamine deaminase RidA (YjgF/YER057c/UK114 family)
MTSSRRRITGAAYAVPVPGFSQAVEISGAGRLIFVSGVTARQADGAITGIGDLGAQTRQVYDNLRQILAEADATLDDVVRIVTYLRDMEAYPQMSAVRRDAWPLAAPASTTVEVSRLYDPEQLIEVEVTAFVPADRGRSRQSPETPAPPV